MVHALKAGLRKRMCNLGECIHAKNCMKVLAPHTHEIEGCG